MTKSSDRELAARLSRIGQELVSIAREISDPLDEPIIPPDAIRKYETQICLKCGKSQEEVKNPFRCGNCPSCRRRIREEINQAEDPVLAEHALIEAGITLPSNFAETHDPASVEVASAIERARDEILKRVKGRRRKRS